MAGGRLPSCLSLVSVTGSDAGGNDIDQAGDRSPPIPSAAAGLEVRISNVSERTNVRASRRTQSSRRGEHVE